MGIRLITMNKPRYDVGEDFSGGEDPLVLGALLINLY